MKTTLIVPLGKSPHPAGRVGPEKLQDWYVELRQAAELSHLLRGSEILILSDVQIPGYDHEADFYSQKVMELGAKHVRVLRQGYHTINQIDDALKIAGEEDRNLLIISSWLHYLRVEWLIRRNPLDRKVKTWHISVWGIPRPKEVMTDVALTFLFPLIDLCGGREEFCQWVEQRRKSGRF